MIVTGASARQRRAPNEPCPSHGGKKQNKKRTRVRASYSRYLSRLRTVFVPITESGAHEWSVIDYESVTNSRHVPFKRENDKRIQLVY